MKPNNRELKVLEKLCLGDVEPVENMPHINMGTIDPMLENGWIEAAIDETYDTHGYKITTLGSETFEKYHRLLRR